MTEEGFQLLRYAIVRQACVDLYDTNRPLKKKKPKVKTSGRIWREATDEEFAEILKKEMVKRQYKRNKLEKWFRDDLQTFANLDGEYLIRSIDEKYRQGQKLFIPLVESARM